MEQSDVQRRAVRFLVFSASLRGDSLNTRLADLAATCLEAHGGSVDRASMGDFDCPSYDADVQDSEGFPEGSDRLRECIQTNDGFVVCSPEYNGSYPALLKNAIDWASSPVAGDPVWSDGTLPFRGKVVGMASASPGGLGGLRAQSHLAPLLLNLQCWLAPVSHAVGQAGQAFDDAGRRQRPQDQLGMKAVLEQVLWAAQRLSA